MGHLPSGYCKSVRGREIELAIFCKRGKASKWLIIIISYMLPSIDMKTEEWIYILQGWNEIDGYFLFYSFQFGEIEKSTLRKRQQDGFSSFSFSLLWWPIQTREGIPYIHPSIHPYTYLSILPIQTWYMIGKWLSSLYSHSLFHDVNKIGFMIIDGRFDLKSITPF